MNNNEFLDILGIEKENYQNYDMSKLKTEFDYLSQKYTKDQVWLKEDYGIYVSGAILEETSYLYVIE